jgi:hypothetical protein
VSTNRQLLAGSDRFRVVWEHNRSKFVEARWSPLLNSRRGRSKKITPNMVIDSFRDNSHKLHSLRFKRGELKQVTRYVLKVGDYGLKVSRHLCDFTGINFKPGKDNRIPEKYKAKLPIKPCKLAKLVGRINMTVPSRKGKINFGSKAFGLFANRKLKIRCGFQAYVPGDFQYNCSNLVTMSTEPQNKLSYGELRHALASRGDIDLRLPIMEDICKPDSVFKVKINPNAYSGLLTSHLFGTPMNKSVNKTMPLAKKVWETCIVNKLIPDTSLWVVGGREKRLDLEGDVIERRTRMVLMNEDIPKIIGNAVLQPFTEALKQMPRSAIMIGQTMGSFGFDDILKKIEDKFNMGVIDADWSQFDNTIYEELIVMAFGIIRACFPEGEHIDNYFMWQCGNMIFKHIVLPESKLVYKFSKGLPSGHPYTSLIGSIINWLVWSHGLTAVTPKDQLKNTSLMIMGDDTLARFCYGTEDRLQHIMSNIGMKLDPFVHRMGPMECLKDGFGKTFLKREWQNGLPCWSYRAIINNLAFPEKRYGLGKEFERVTMLKITAPFQSEATKVLDLYAEHLANLIGERNCGVLTLTKEVISDCWMSEYNRMSQNAYDWFLGNRDSEGLEVEPGFKSAKSRYVSPGRMELTEKDLFLGRITVNLSHLELV